MSLRVWLPLTKDLRQQGLSNIKVENHNATLNTAGKLGSCYYFNGSQQWLQFDTVLGDYYNNDWSIACWLKPTDSTRSVIISEYSSTGASNVGLELTASRVVRLYWNGSPDINFTTAGALPINEWTHLTITKQARVVKVYFNGELKQTYTNSSDFSTRTSASYPRIGDDYRGNSSSTVSYQGYINDFRMYDHCLSLMEVKQISQGLILYYPLNRNGWGQENLYTTSQDFSGSWNNKGSWTTSEETYQNFIVKQKSTVWGGLSQNIPCSNGDIFTISFYAKVDVGGRICSVHRSSLGNVTTGLTILGGNFISGTDWVNATNDGIQWKRYWATVRIDSSDITYLQWRIENSIADKTLYICGMKMERGSIATPWCPNSADTLATTMNLNSTIEYDCSGFCNNGMRTGTFTWTSDTPKYAVSTNFSTISQHIYLNYDTNGFKDSYSIGLWLKYNSTQTNTAPEIFGIPAYACLFISGNLIYWNTNDGTNNPFKNNGSTLSITPYVDNWHHFVITGNGTNVILYIDGVEAGRATTYKHFGGTKIVLSDKDNTRNTFSFIGLASDFRIYATALSASDVKSLYQNSAYIDSSGNVYGAVHSEV